MDLAGPPGFDQIVFARDVLIISHGAAGTVDLFDPHKRRLIGHIRQMSSPRGIAVDEAAKLAYIANAGAHNIVLVSTEDWQVKRILPLEAEPESLLLLPERKLLYVTFPQSNAVAVLDLSLQTPPATLVRLDGRPAQFAYDSSRSRIYLSIQDRRTVLVLSPSLETLSRWTLDASEPTGLAFDFHRNRLYVAVRYAVLSLDPEGGREIARAPVAAGIDQIVLSPAGDCLLGAAESSVFVLPVSSSLGDPKEMPIAVKAHTLAYDSAQGLIYLPGGLEGKSKLLILKWMAK